MPTRNQQNAVSGSSYAVLPFVILTFLLGASATITGCRSSTPSAPATMVDNNAGTDPSDANLAPASSQPTYTSSPAPRTEKVRALGAQQNYTPQQSAEQYPQTAAQQYPEQYPQQAPAPVSQQPSPQYPGQSSSNGYDSGEAAGYEALADASQPPPPLPEYEQPPVTEPNDLWTPGYWNYAPQGYYWVPGAWVAPPYSGALWTPAYWGYDGGRYRLHRGFWARHIGFYGGINYGFGYTGTGYRGGYWNGNNFFYNRAVNRVNVTNIHNVYERNITVNNITRVSYNGGNGGIQARPGPQELAVLHEQRIPPMSTQIQLREASAQNRQQFFNENHGRPAEPFAARPIAAERGIQPPPAQTFQQQAQRPQPPNQAFNQQRLNQEQQHPVGPNQNRFEAQQEQQRPTPYTARPEPSNFAQQHPQPGIQPQQNAGPERLQQQRIQQQQAAEQQQRFQQQQHTNQQQQAAEQQQRLQQQQRTDQQQQAAEQQQRLVQQQHNQQQQAEQQRVQQQQRASQQQAEQQRNMQQRPAPPQAQPRADTQPRTEVQPRPQQPHPQAQAQPHPQPQPQAHAEAPKAEPSHGGRPEH